MHSSTRPHRASRTTSRTGASPWCTPRAAMEAPMADATSRTRASSKLAPQASGVGNVAAFQAASPVRHSSCAMAGMPRRGVVTEHGVLKRGDDLPFRPGPDPQARDLRELLLKGHVGEERRRAVLRARGDVQGLLEVGHELPSEMMPL